MNFLHVHFEMISSLEHLTASFTRMGHKPTLVLVSHVTQQCTLEVKDARTNGALKLGPLGGLTHGVHRVCVGDPFEAGRGLAGRRGKGWRAPCGGRGPYPTTSCGTSF